MRGWGGEGTKPERAWQARGGRRLLVVVVRVGGTVQTPDQVGQLEIEAVGGTNSKEWKIPDKWK